MVSTLHKLSRYISDTIFRTCQCVHTNIMPMKEESDRINLSTPIAISIFDYEILCISISSAVSLEKIMVEDRGRVVVLGDVILMILVQNHLLIY